MADSSEVQALEKISTEVGDSQIKITLSNQCIKAQAFLVDKLRKQVERQKEICNFISNSNFKLQTEIKQAESEIKSLTVAHDTIKSANVELRKDCLLIKERKTDVEQRIQNGKKKYEELWMKAKNRYEGIPFVQKLLQANSKSQVLEENILSLENNSKELYQELKAKKRRLADLDKKRVIELAEFIVYYLPHSLKTIKEKSDGINSLTKEIDELSKEREIVPIKISTVNVKAIEQKKTSDHMTLDNSINDGWLNICQNERNTIMMPTLQLINSDFDILSAKLDEIKIKKVDILNTVPIKRLDSMQDVTDISCKRFKKDDDISPYFNKPFNKESFEGDKKKDNYSRKKLINILEDIKIDNNDAYNIVSKVNPDKLQEVEKIGAEGPTNEKQYSEAFNKNRKVEDNEDIEEIDLTKASNDNLIIPPTQFLDYSQGNIFGGSQQQVEVIVHMSMTDPTNGKDSQAIKNSQESFKKRVSFDIPNTIQELTNEISLDDNKTSEGNDENKISDTIDSQVDISLASDESYSKIKDIILKKHNLDLSPQFVYAKNNILQVTNEEKIVSSKFFQPNNKNLINVNNKNESKITEIVVSAYNADNICDDPKPKENNQLSPNKTYLATMETDEEVVVSSPKATQAQKMERSVAGLLFNHGAQGIPDSLNVSISTTGYEDGDADYPRCIDSSLLLSPKADLPMPMSGDNAEFSSQEVPNFLSGLRKTGFSFFGNPTSTNSKPDTSGQAQGNNFNFNFGGDEKKSRGGLFSMFR